ncbi:MAG TPA: dolichyl-phosphate beta-glucosyltransferase [Bryobacteraceae bacterium]|jgi:dolichyl-phosphate beta-glucosyltransferase|nr:dolichyl-phosphate beta-glucosyltransferase [Bryobacteraceae bacterium]
MPSDPDISLILPAYNEARVIPLTIADAVRYFGSRGLVYEIIVAADGSDGTREVVRELARENPALSAIGHQERSGKGRGIREAVERALGAVIGYADADNKVPIDEFDNFRPWLEKGIEAVIGTRRGGARIERHQPLYRRIGSRGFLWFMQTVVGLPGINDTQCGFKFFQRAAAKELFRRQKIDAYMFDVEVLAIARRLGYRIQQVPVRWRDDADSRLDLVSGNLRNVRDIFRIGLDHRFGGRAS